LGEGAGGCVEGGGEEKGEECHYEGDCIAAWRRVALTQPE
jgi:hypothetical protein